jgi:hypothetical protein
MFNDHVQIHVCFGVGVGCGGGGCYKWILLPAKGTLQFINKMHACTRGVECKASLRTTLPLLCTRSDGRALFM